jgi:hypothetical protein
VEVSKQVRVPVAEPMRAENHHDAKRRDIASKASGPVAELRGLSLALWAPLFSVSVLLAAYTGFRLPNLWSATLYTVSFQDGFHRRFVVGTLLHPLSSSLSYNYWLYATVAFVILCALIVVLASAACRARLASQRFLVIAFLLLPTGGFLFHEVGYLDQLLYLLLFASLWLVRRSAWMLASVLMVVAVLTHEIAILTVIPVFYFAVLREGATRRALSVLMAPTVFAVILLLIPATEDGAVHRLGNTLRVSNFTPRADALSLFERSQSETMNLYSVRDVFLYLLPFALVGVAAFLLVYCVDPRHQNSNWLYPTLAVGAIAAPALLAFAGWDEWRWAFLLVSNFAVVVWIWLGDRRQELKPVQWAVLGFVLLVGLHTNLRYFDGFAPRAVRPSAIRELRHQIEDGTLFEIPTR